MAPEFRLQTLLAVSAIALAVIAPLLKSLPLKLLVSLLVGGGLAAISLPLWQFGLIQAGLAEAYREPVSLAWGWWLVVAGVVLSIIGGVWATRF
jgi:hypothetical protein